MSWTGFFSQDRSPANRFALFIMAASDNESIHRRWPLTSSNSTISLAGALIARASVTPSDEGCQALIAKRLAPLGFNIESFDCDGVANLYARRGTGEPHLTFIGHTDVVPVGDTDAWQYPPFSATIADGFLHGRGAADMKGSIAAMVTAVERFLGHDGCDFDGSISILLTSDEEGPAVTGVRHALDQLTARGERLPLCLVGEPTSEQALGDTIKIGRRGSLTGIITVKGRQGHVAYPQHADNPVHHAGALISALAKLAWHDGDAEFPDTTLQMTNVTAGVGADNVIPGTLQLNFNIRFSPAQNAPALQREIEQLCHHHLPVFTIEWKPASAPYRSHGDAFAKLVSAAVSDVIGTEPHHSTSGGTSDGRFAAQHGAQVVEFGPLNATIHQVNECVSTRDLQSLSMIYQRVLERLLTAENSNQ